MSLPNIPNISPEIKLNKREVIHLMIASIAMEEISLSHLLNAEGEKIQSALKKCVSIEHLLRINKSVERTLRNIVKQEMLLQFKLEDVLDFHASDHHHCPECERCHECEECYECEEEE